MSVLQKPSSPSGRVESGDAVLNASKVLKVGAIKQRLANFEKSHRAFSAAEDRVRAAEEKLRAQQTLAGEADDEQDAAVEALANRLVRDGARRMNPFKQFDCVSPSRLVKVGYAEEAKLVHRLVAAVRKWKGASRDTLQVAKRADDAATRVEAELKRVTPLLAARSSLMVSRDALVPAWDAAFAALKRGARFAEDDGEKDLFASLFETTAR